MPYQGKRKIHMRSGVRMLPSGESRRARSGAEVFVGEPLATTMEALNFYHDN